MRKAVSSRIESVEDLAALQRTVELSPHLTVSLGRDRTLEIIALAMETLIRREASQKQTGRSERGK